MSNTILEGGSCLFSVSKCGVFFLSTKLDFTQQSQKSEWSADVLKPRHGLWWRQAEQLGLEMR